MTSENQFENKTVIPFNVKFVNMLMTYNYLFKFSKIVIHSLHRLVCFKDVGNTLLKTI